MDFMDILSKVSRRWIESLGLIASISLLTFVILEWRHFVGSEPNDTDVLLSLTFVLLPAFVAVFTSIAARFWVNFVIGLWFIFLGSIIFIELGPAALLLPGLALAATPFLRRAFQAASPKSDASGRA